MSTGSREREKFSLNFPDLSLSWAFHVYGLFVAPIMELAPGGGRVGLGHHWAVGWIWLAGWSCRIDIRQWRTEVGLKVNLELRGWNLESSLLKGNCSLILWETDWKIRKGKGGTRERGILKEAIRVDGKRRFGFLAPRRVQRWPEMVESIPRKNREEFLWKTMITCGGREIPATRESAELDEGTWKGCRRQGYIFGKGGTFSRYGIQSQYFGRNGDGTRVATKRRLEVINHGKIMSLGIGEVWSTTFLNCRTVMWVVTNGAQVLAQFYFKGMIYSGTQWELINEISEVFMLIMHGLHEFTLFYVWVPANKLSKKEKGAVYKSGPRYQGITTADFIRRQPKQWRFKRIIKGFIIYFTIQNDIVRDWGNHSDNKQASHSTMADEVAGLMGNLKFSEEELVDVNNIGEEMVETMEGTEKWAVGHGWELCVERPVEFQGPFQFGEWLKVDLGKERQTARRKLGIVYADRKFERERKEGSGDHMLEGQTEEGRILQQKGKDKMVGTSTKMRTMKRTLKCKNESILNCPIANVKEDVLRWSHHHSGLYVTKTAHHWRNRWVHPNQLIPRKLVADFAQMLIGDKLDSQNSMHPQSADRAALKWMKPELGWIKVNVDGAWLERENMAAIGVVARDHNGLLLDARAKRLEGSYTPEIVEACAIVEGVRVAVENGWQRVIFEGDSSGIISKMNAGKLDRSVVATHLFEA
ncbi:hypothetical protein V6N11_047023 [Hibiscus sabdariffa]|uniref:RNase H type-1 domain-containing protein n=1 Tax=Hibiscus sabdariffa TaxID=183260 RepID=A0ABR2NAG1_9ROSI